MPSTFVCRTFSQPAAGNSSSGAPQVAPALLTRMSSVGKRSRVGVASRRAPSGVEMSAGIASHSPSAASSRGGGLDVSLLARGDDHARAGVDEPAGDHQADPARAAGDERGLAGDVEQVAHPRDRGSRSLVGELRGALLEERAIASGTRACRTWP